MLDRFVVCAALLLAFGAPADARILNAVVTHVSDGDSVWIRPAGGSAALQLRLQDIDAPEICQEFGLQARDALAARVLRRQVRVVIRARDVYQRAVGRVSLHGQDMGGSAQLQEAPRTLPLSAPAPAFAQRPDGYPWAHAGTPVR
jgi:micrococcal nuclease